MESCCARRPAWPMNWWIASACPRHVAARLDVVTPLCQPLGIGAKDVREALFGSPERRARRAVERPAPPDLEGESSHLRRCLCGGALARSRLAARATVITAGPRANAGSLPPAASPGEGAQATVWLAHDPLLDREVAIRCCSRARNSAAWTSGCTRARAVSRLNHPHIVPVFEADTQNGQSYLVFEYVEAAPGRPPARPPPHTRTRGRGVAPGRAGCPDGRPRRRHRTGIQAHQHPADTRVPAAW